MFIMLLTKKIVQIMYFVIKLIILLLFSHLKKKNFESVKMKTISKSLKYFMFGKYSSN